MPIPPTQIAITGTPITSQLGVGALAPGGNAVTISGLTLQPNQPGWHLTSWTGGPGEVSGAWQYGSASASAQRGDATGPGAQGGAQGSGGGGVGGDGYANYLPPGQSGGGISKTGWALLVLAAVLILKDKK